MSKAKKAGKKPVKAKTTFKKIAAKAMKMIKPAKSAKAAKPVKAKATPASKPVSKPAMSTSSKPVRGIGGSAAAGRTITEADIRRMPESAYMNDTQLEFFRVRLLQMRSEVVDREVDVKERLHQRESFADPADRATAEEEHWLDLRLRERESLLLRKIDEALHRLRDREYGFCEVTGEPIGIPRLLARPTATVCVDVKGQNEQIESQFRDR
jgi:DnaK suppressor protein